MTERLLPFLATGIRTAADIQQRFGCSQPTVSRIITLNSDRIFIIGRARSRRYTRLRDVRGLGGEFPVYKIDSDGNAHQLGILFAVAQDEYCWRPAGGQESLFKSLPWFLADLRPEGFVGRSFVRQLHQELSLPERSIDWNEDHVLTALARRGEDCMGNLVVGQESVGRYLRMAHDLPPPVRMGDIPAAYQRLAQAALDGQPVGSSAGGEQPKFTAFVERDGTARHVLVKFSPSVGTVEGRRWADLLVCEHHALRIVQEAGIPAAGSHIVEAGGRLFLEVERFDRVGRNGREPIISLRAVDNEFYGHQDNWVNAANRMEQDGRLAAADAGAMRWLAAFGALIANSDQHFGNISLVMKEGSRRFDLAPAYDVLPMLYRPVDGTAPNRVFTPPVASPGAPREWETALRWAGVFWDRVRDDARISEGFRRICAENCGLVQALKSGPRLVI